MNNNCYNCKHLKVKIPIIDEGFLDYDKAKAYCKQQFITDQKGEIKYFKNPFRVLAHENKSFRLAEDCEEFESMLEDTECGLLVLAK